MFLFKSLQSFIVHSKRYNSIIFLLRLLSVKWLWWFLFIHLWWAFLQLILINRCVLKEYLFVIRLFTIVKFLWASINGGSYWYISKLPILWCHLTRIWIEPLFLKDISDGWLRALILICIVLNRMLLKNDFLGIQ